MSNLFKALKPHATPSRNGFDLSQKHVFSSKAGQLIPCLSVETVPGDKFEIDMSAFMRTQAMNSAAFLRGKFHYDFFFVPYSQLWHNFNLFITERDDKHSTRQQGFSYCPVVALPTVLSFAWRTDSVSLTEAEHLYYFDVHYTSIGRNIVRLLDMLGYGNYDWIFECTTFAELADALTYSEIFDKYVNLFRIAAYQHIFYDWYRNKYYEVDNTGGINNVTASTYIRSSVSCFNFDDLACDTFANSILTISDSDEASLKRFAGLFTIRYAQWKKDLFTSSLPSQQFGVVSSVDISRVNINLDGTVTQNSNAVVSSSTKNLFVSGGGSSWTIPSAFDVLSLRKAEVLQNYKQNMLRAGNMTDDNFDAHYGVKPYYSSDENVLYLGSFSSKLDVNPVEVTAQTGEAINGRAGEVAANGTSLVTEGEKIRFDAKDFGVIMCIENFVPDSEYQSRMLDKANSLFERYDFFTPEFENIGLEAIDMSFVNMNRQKASNASPLGYAPRYWMYKSALDKVHGEFAGSSFSYTESGTTTSFNGGNSLASWVAPRSEGLNNNGRLLMSLYVSPTVFDNVFGVSANANQNTDQFLHNVFFDVKAIRPMSVLGLPQF